MIFSNPVIESSQLCNESYTKSEEDKKNFIANFLDPFPSKP